MKSEPRLSNIAAGVLAFVLAVGTAPATAQDQSRKIHGIAIENLDPAVKPGDDFSEYANGNWIKRTEIRPDRSRAGVFSTLTELSEKRTVDLIEEAAKANAPAGSGARKIADLYNSYMDEAAIEQKGVAPLRAGLDAISGIKNKKDLARALGETLRADVDPLNNTNFYTPNLFGLWVAPAFSDPDHYIAYLLQGGVLLPDREYYVAGSERMRAIRTQYQAHIAAMLSLAGFPDADPRAGRIVELERAIAEKHASLSDSEDVHKANNTWRLADFSVHAPGLDWPEFFRGAGLAGQRSFIVWQPEAFTGESALVGSEPLDTWKDWLAYHAIEGYANVLPKPFVEERFAFFNKTLTGIPQAAPRWQRGVRLVNTLLGDAVGQLYAQRYFSPQAKAQAQAMVANIIAAFHRRIDTLAWMSPATKAEAQAKLNTLYVGIGYPETWQDYSAYEVKSDDAFGNVRRAALFQYHHEVARLGGKVDRREWCMTPQTVNAVNLPLQNALNFPAAILAPPFFDPEAPAAVNYGAIGSIIGHEVSHTFDTTGAMFDSRGGLRNWWSPDDLKYFETATAKLSAQYDAYRPFPDLAINGKQTLGENIADVAGIAASYDGYRMSLGGNTAPMQDDFTGDQQFFIAFGQNYASKIREPALRQQVLTDAHSPAPYRADTVRNIDAWYDAFHVRPTDKLFLPLQDRVRIW